MQWFKISYSLSLTILCLGWDSAGPICLLVLLRIFHEATFHWQLGQGLNIQDICSCSRSPKCVPVEPRLPYSMGSGPQERNTGSLRTGLGSPTTSLPSHHFGPNKCWDQPVFEEREMDSPSWCQECHLLFADGGSYPETLDYGIISLLHSSGNRGLVGPKDASKSTRKWQNLKTSLE